MLLELPLSTSIDSFICQNSTGGTIFLCITANLIVSSLSCPQLSGAEFLENQREIRNICGCTYSRLKKVRINGFEGNWYEMELITHILKSAISLDQVVISPLRSFYLGGGESTYNWFVSSLTPDESWRESRQDSVRKSLQEITPAGVHLVVF